MTEQEAYVQAFEHGRQVGYEEGKKDAVKHAHWEDEYGGKYANPRYRCSACKGKALYRFKRDLLDNWKEEQALTDWCPHCGAKMDEVEGA